MNTLTLFTLIFNGITLIAVCVWQYCVNKRRKLYKAKISVRDDTIDLLTKELNKYRDRYIKTCVSGVCGHSRSTLSIEAGRNYYSLYSYINDRGTDYHKILIKQFPYSIYDDDDKTYAYRCAEELKEKMEEEI